GGVVYEGQHASCRVSRGAHAHGRRSGTRLGQGRKAFEHDGFHRKESAAGPIYEGIGTMFGGKAVKKLVSKAVKPAEHKPVEHKPAEHKPAKKNGLTE